MNLDKALDILRLLGGEWYPKRRTGEIICRHPLVPGVCLVNGRRKDSPRSLTAMLIRLARSIH